MVDVDSGQFYYREAKDGGGDDDDEGEEDEVDLDDVLPQHHRWENGNDRSWEDAALVDRAEKNGCDDDTDEYDPYYGGTRGVVPWNGHYARRESFEDETADPILEPFPNNTGGGGTSAAALRLRGDALLRGDLLPHRRHRRACLLALLLVVAVTVITVLGVVGVQGGSGAAATGNATTAYSSTNSSSTSSSSTNTVDSDLELGLTEPSITPVGPVFAEGSPQPSPPSTATTALRTTDPPSLPPTPSPTPLPSTVGPTETDPCPSEATAIRECFEHQGNNDSSTTASILEAAVAQAACESCVLQAAGPVSSTGSTLCQDDDQGVRTDVCSAVWGDDCHCSPCASSVEEYLSCRSNCTLDCYAGSDAGGGTPQVTSPAPTPPLSAPLPETLSPTVPLRCPDEDAAFNACSDSSSSSSNSNGGSDECLFCLLSYWPATPSGTAECLTVEDATCLGLSSCNCGNQCSAEFVDLVGCLTGCPTFACR